MIYSRRSSYKSILPHPEHAKDTDPPAYRLLERNHRPKEWGEVLQVDELRICKQFFQVPDSGQGRYVLRKGCGL